MAVTILKKTPIHCVIKVTGAATETITLASLATANQTASSPKVNISGLAWASHNDKIEIVRNGVTLWQLADSFQFEMNGWADIQENGSDLVVTVPSKGTVVIELMKVSGYGDSQHRNQLGAG